MHTSFSNMPKNETQNKDEERKGGGEGFSALHPLPSVRVSLSL
jgi:hypothetical protein